MRHHFLATAAVAAVFNAAILRREGSADFEFAQRAARLVVRNAIDGRNIDEFTGAVMADAALNEDGPFVSRLLAVWDDVTDDLIKVLKQLLAWLLASIPRSPA